MALFSRGPHEYWLKPHFSKNEVAKSGYTTERGYPRLGVLMADFSSARVKGFERNPL